MVTARLVAERDVDIVIGNVSILVTWVVVDVGCECEDESAEEDTADRSDNVGV